MKRSGLLPTVIAGVISAGCVSRAPVVEPPNLEASDKGYPIWVKRSRVEPHYAHHLMKAGVTGCVVAAFDLNEDQRPQRLEVLDSQPPGVFDDAVLKAVGGTRFIPTEGPGRYATFVSFSTQGIEAKPHQPCIAVPNYEQLNQSHGQ